MSQIPNRPPETPLNQFYALGKYDKPITQRRRMSCAKPGLAATLVERNPRDRDEIEVKPQIHTKFDTVVYKPGKYMDARKEHQTMNDRTSPASNLTMGRLLNMRRSIAEHTTSVPL